MADERSRLPLYHCAPVRPEPTASGRATCHWKIQERNAKKPRRRGRDRYRVRVLKSINRGFTNEKTDPDADSDTDPDSQRGSPRFAGRAKATPFRPFRRGGYSRRGGCMSHF
jgi:hypothetical protein